MQLRAEQERALIVGMLTTLGASHGEAASVAEVTTEADLRGYPSQGLMRFPMLVRRTRTGAIRTGTRPSTVRETEASAVLDGRGGYGQHVGIQAVDLAVAKARHVGVGAVAVRNANHVGMCGYYAERAARAGCIGVATSTTEAIVHPHGGVEPLLGTNPLAVAFPAPGDPFLLDMATSALSMGRILEASEEGRPLPPGSALDPQGRPTQDPKEALQGVLSPMAGPKGYGLGLAVAALAALSGAALGREVVGTLTPEEAVNKGDFYLALDVEAFCPLAEFRDRVGRYLREVRESIPAAGVPRVRLPGERTFRSREGALERGYDVYDDLWEEIVQLGEEIGFEVPGVLRG